MSLCTEEKKEQNKRNRKQIAQEAIYSKMNTVLRMKIAFDRNICSWIRFFNAFEPDYDKIKKPFPFCEFPPLSFSLYVSGK